MKLLVKFTVIAISLIVIVPGLMQVEANSNSVPDWVKNTAKWYGDGNISESDFLHAIKFLIQQKIIIIDDSKLATEPYIIIPNGNAQKGNHGFYEPMHLDIETGTVVTWKNQDDYGHTVQSQDETGHVIPLFNSNILLTGQTFEYEFSDYGDFQYFCTLHPWRVGTISVI